MQLFWIFSYRLPRRTGFSRKKYFVCLHTCLRIRPGKQKTQKMANWMRVFSCEVELISPHKRALCFVCVRACMCTNASEKQQEKQLLMQIADAFGHQHSQKMSAEF